MSEWQPIETAPKDGTKILAFCPNVMMKKPGIRITWWRLPEHKQGYTGWGEFNADLWPPTYWMPLPDPPKDAGE